MQSIVKLYRIGQKRFRRSMEMRNIEMEYRTFIVIINALSCCAHTAEAEKFWRTQWICSKLIAQQSKAEKFLLDGCKLFENKVKEDSLYEEMVNIWGVEEKHSTAASVLISKLYATSSWWLMPLKIFLLTLTLIHYRKQASKLQQWEHILQSFLQNTSKRTRD